MRRRGWFEPGRGNAGGLRLGEQEAGVGDELRPDCHQVVAHGGEFAHIFALPEHHLVGGARRRVIRVKGSDERRRHDVVAGACACGPKSGG